MVAFDRIEVNPAKMNGQPCIAGTRITVRRVVQLIATYPNRDELKNEFPELGDNEIRQALLFAATALPDSVTTIPELFVTNQF